MLAALLVETPEQLVDHPVGRLLGVASLRHRLEVIGRSFSAIKTSAS